MSLHTLANHLQQAGRGDDKMLVHMTPREVGGLQQLAMAHGGSLTINPQTGLPEAGFLSSLLPMIAGFALGPAGLGLMSAGQAALTVGAVSTLATGSLSKGIMAGFGAYGGAELGGALMGAGTAAANPLLEPGVTAAQRAAAFAPQAPTLAGTMAANPVLRAATEPAFGGLAANAANAIPNVAQQVVSAAPKAISQPVFSNYMQGNLTRGVSSAARPISEIKITQPDLGTFGGRLSAIGQGVKNVTESPEKLWDFVKDNKLALAGVASAVAESMEPEVRMPGKKDVKPLERYRYVYDQPARGVPSMFSAERNYFPGARYEPTGEFYAAGGGLMALANGGAVESMSRLNAVGANTGYPMANQMSSTYATPAERPISENIIRPQGESNIDPYTGAEKFAEGGETDSAATTDFFNLRYNPATGKYEEKTSAPAAPSTQPATPEQIADLYQKSFGRPPDITGLKYYTEQKRPIDQLAREFKGSEEYFSNLTRPFVPAIQYGAKGVATIDEAPRYDPTQYGFPSTHTNVRNEIKGLFQENLGEIPRTQDLNRWDAIIGADNVITPEEVTQFKEYAAGEKERRKNLYLTPTVPGGSVQDTITSGSVQDTITGGDVQDTITGGDVQDTTVAGGGTDTISTDPNAYKYNYFDNSAEDNALIKKFQSGNNPKTRADLVEYYITQLGRVPDEAGFNHWVNKFGEELDPNEMKELQAASQKEIGQRTGLEALYRQYGQRDYDIPGLEYWMGEAGRAGGLDPIKEKFITGIKKEIEMGNAGYRPGLYDPNQVGSRLTAEEAAQLEAEAPFKFGEDSTGAANRYSRQQLLDLYQQNLGRKLPDSEGFNYWIREIGDDNYISPAEAKRFLDEANKKTGMADGGSVREQTANLLQERLGSAPDASQIDYFSGIFGLDNQITPDELARLDTAVGIAKQAQTMSGQRNEFGGPTGEVGPDAARRFAEQYNQAYKPGEPVRFGDDPAQVISRKAEEYGLYNDPDPQRQMENLVEMARMSNRAAVRPGQKYEQFNRDTLQYDPKVSQGMMGDYFTTSPYFYQTSVQDQIQNERAARLNEMRLKFPHITDENELLRLYTQQSGFDPTRMASYDYKANIGSPGGLKFAGGGLSDLGAYLNNNKQIRHMADGGDVSREEQVRKIYQDVLGRSADDSGLQYYTTGEGKNYTASQLSDMFGASREGQLQKLYRDVLGRSADTGGMSYYLQGEGKNLAPSQISKIFKGSEEYKNKPENLLKEAMLFGDNSYRALGEYGPNSVGRQGYLTPKGRQEMIEVTSPKIVADLITRGQSVGLSPDEIQQAVQSGWQSGAESNRKFVTEEREAQANFVPTWFKIGSALAGAHMMGSQILNQGASALGTPAFGTPFTGTELGKIGAAAIKGYQDPNRASATNIVNTLFPSPFGALPPIEDVEFFDHGGQVPKRLALGGVSDLGAYSDGGRLLKGPGDGVSDSIPAVIGDRQPARLADGEFVIPARIVSELGNGSTDAGARKLYAMMDRIQGARRKSVGKGRVAANTRADKYLPA